MPLEQQALRAFFYVHKQDKKEAVEMTLDKKQKIHKLWFQGHGYKAIPTKSINIYKEHMFWYDIYRGG